MQSSTLSTPPISQSRSIPLSKLSRHTSAQVTSVANIFVDDSVAQRLRDIGFMPGMSVRVVAHAPWGGDAMVVKIGATRFALRRTEAERINVVAGQA